MNKKRYILGYLMLLFCLLLPTQKAQAKTISLSNTSVTIYEGSSKTLKVTGTDQKITWSTSDKKIVTVNNGVLKAKKAGKAVIKAKVGKKTMSCKVTVKKCSLSATRKTIKGGQGFTLKLTGTKIKKVESSDKLCVEVDQSGYVYGEGRGWSLVTVTGTNGKKYKCEVFVTSDSKQPEFNVSRRGALVGDNFHLKLKDFSGKYTLCSSNTKLVKVDSKGLVTIVGADKTIGGGMVTVYARLGDGTGEVLASATIDVLTCPKVEFVEGKEPVSFALDYYGMVGQKWQIKADGLAGKIIWKSSNPSVAKVDSKGNITALKPGKVKIYTQAAGKNVSQEIRIESKWVYSDNGTVRKKTFYDGSVLTETRYTVEGTNDQVWGIFDKTVAKEFCDKLNKIRKENGKTQYTWSEELYKRSKQRAVYHAKHLSEYYETGIYFESGVCPMTADYAMDYMLGHTVFLDDDTEFAIACFYHDYNTKADSTVYRSKYGSTYLFTVMNGYSE